jgi:predicted nuclease with TOPRIM domain
VNKFKKVKLQIKIIEDLVNNNCQQNDIFIQRIAELKEMFHYLKEEWAVFPKAISKKHEEVIAMEHELNRSNNRFSDYKAIQDSLNHMTAHNGQLQRKLKRIENKKAN